MRTSHFSVGRIIKNVCILGVLMYVLIWLPWLYIRYNLQNHIYYELTSAPNSDIAVVFGGLHDQASGLTETNQERILAAKALLDEAKIQKIVLSNTLVAVNDMKEFLVDRGVSEDEIALDTNAVVTLDTCKYMNHFADNRKVIFISHGYHLPRVLYQCTKEGLKGAGFAPDKMQLIQRTEVSKVKKYSIRFIRYQREAFLTFASIIGAY